MRKRERAVTGHSQCRRKCNELGAPANVINGCGEQRGLRGATAEVAKEAGSQAGREGVAQGEG